MSLGIRVSQVGEHISLGMCVSQVVDHISLGICVSQVGEHIYITRDYVSLLVFSVIYVSVDITIVLKKGLGFVVWFFCLKVWVAMQFTAKTPVCLNCEITFHPTIRGWRFQNRNFLDA